MEKADESSKEPDDARAVHSYTTSNASLTVAMAKASAEAVLPRAAETRNTDVSWTSSHQRRNKRWMKPSLKQSWIFTWSWQMFDRVPNPVLHIVQHQCTVTHGSNPVHVQTKHQTVEVKDVMLPHQDALPTTLMLQCQRQHSHIPVKVFPDHKQLFLPIWCLIPHHRLLSMIVL